MTSWKASKVLEPFNRRLLFDALRPPAGYDVDAAIGTTFSLDLMTLLAVPLAFALFDIEDSQGRVNPDPTALLEAGRRYADRTHIFCHAGQIHLPIQRSPLFYQLENIIHEVLPPNDHGVFHPKVWILRLAPRTKHQPVLYRLLCSSRNLTFDRSWDTLLVLEGELTDRELAIANNHPLGEFVQALPKMMTSAPSEALRKTVERVDQEVRRVRFSVPEGFEEIGFHALGLPNHGNWWFDSSSRQVLAMAPFVDSDFVTRLRGSAGPCVLISRLEQLQELTPGLLADCHKTFFLDPATDEPMPDEAGMGEPSIASGEADSLPADSNLSGLHAKLYIMDFGWKSSVWTGSANATTAAFTRNVEFLVRLTGKKSVCGVEAFLARSKGQTCFADMLKEFTSQAEPEPGDTDARKAEQLADQTRQYIARLRLVAHVTHLDADIFNIAVGSQHQIPNVFKMDDVEVTCWPLTVPERNSQPAKLLLERGKLLFSKLSFESLTSFYAFHVKAVSGKRTHEIRFVMNLPVEGMPADRTERMLRVILHNRNQVLRMLLLLLADANNDLHAQLSASSSQLFGDAEQGAFSSLGDAALLEPLLITLEHNPKRLERVARLMADLHKTEDGINLFPPGFIQVWEPIWQVAQQLINEDIRR